MADRERKWVVVRWMDVIVIAIATVFIYCMNICYVQYSVCTVQSLIKRDKMNNTVIRNLP